MRKSTTQSSCPSVLVLFVQIIDIWSDLSGGAWFVLGTVDLYAGRWNGAEELAKQTRMFLELLQTLFQELSPENENVRLVAAANMTTNKATTCEHFATALLGARSTPLVVDSCGTRSPAQPDPKRPATALGHRKWKIFSRTHIQTWGIRPWP